MTDNVYQPVLSRKEAQARLDRVYDYQIDEIPRADLGEDGPRQIPLTPARHAALAVMSALSGRRGLDLHEVVGDVEIIGEIVDEATDIIGAAFDLGEGPVTVEVAQAINTVHSEGKNWQVGYNADTQMFNYLQFTAGAPEDEHSSGMCSRDSLYAAIMDLRTRMEKSE